MGLSLKKWCLLCLCAITLASAHPHVFVDASIVVFFDETGFAGVRNQWVYDELYSVAMMSTGDADGDGNISQKENEWFCKAILGPLRESNYYNYVQMGSDFLRVRDIRNFKATFRNNRLVLNFEAVFSGPATSDYTMLVMTVADPTNYIQITTDMEKADVSGPESLEIEFFNDALQGLTLFKAFRSDIEGLYLRYKKK
ncbi:DUF1007 family protein [uncultured Fibrobacter sp.]|uniref:DUF1007 family protein n=1 Tax=uncultured Fibrobacter sp. TaxID=261512 RepID=UPI00261CB2EC|nr:DUF1007 family protein [uncultured Fibrobacter sp.]